MVFQRRAGILFHITSLPSIFGIGDFGKEAFDFVDLLYKSGQTLWQILPINPTSMNFGNSPYHSLSTFAGNFILISPQKLYEYGLLSKEDLDNIKISQSDKVQYELVYERKREILRRAFKVFNFNLYEFEEFLSEEKHWLETYAVFSALREKTKKEWHQWDQDLRRINPNLIDKVCKDLYDDVRFFMFEQFIFFKQWFELKRYANAKGVLIIGDMPIYPSYDSCDVWENPQLFKLDENMNMLYVAGVPPDFFSSTGQLWGNPVYDWSEHVKEGFRWWIARLHHAFKLYDYVRIDHFRGLIAYWEVPSYETTAINGKWVYVPFDLFFRTIFRKFPSLPVIAEDLGFITEDVKYIREVYGIPGMKVLQFAFYEENSAYLPHNVEKNSVIYTGTHDNPPTRAWFRELDPSTKSRVQKYVGVQLDEENISEYMIRLAYISPANFAIVPMQDILSLDEDARMNTPGSVDGNWKWKLSNFPDEKFCSFLYDLSKIYGR